MTEEIINSDGSRNWEANILLDNIKRLEQENKELKDRNVELQITLNEFDRFSNYRSALEEIREIVKPYLTDCQGSLCEPIDEVLTKINEVLQ